MPGNKYFHMLRLMRNEKRPLAELRNIQNEKLRRLIDHAYHHVPFYRERFKKINLHPDDIRTIDDLQKIPVIDKDDFHQSENSDLIDKKIKNIDQLITLHTSGSSGKTLHFFADHGYNQIRKAQFLRPYLTNGNGLFDRVLWFRATPRSKQPFHERLGFLKTYQLDAGMDPLIQIKSIQTLKPAMMRGYGSTFHLMASKILEENISVPPPRIIFTDSELLSTASRRKIEKAFQTRVIDVYGTFETENVAYECHKHEGYHMAIDCVIMEFLKEGNPVKPGEVGEIVFTVLDNYTFPFIRYNIHDLAAYTDRPCSCGRTFPLMKIIAGRMYDYAKKSDGTKISSTPLTSHMWFLGKYIHEFQVIQEDIDQFSVLIVPTKFYSDKAAKKVEKGIYKNFPKAKIKIHLVDQIKREASGKFIGFKTLLTRP